MLIALPPRAWLPLALAVLAPLALLGAAWLSRRRARGIATVLALRTVVLLGIGFAVLAGIATFFVFNTGLSELHQRHEADVRALAREVGASPLGLAGADAQLHLALFRAKDASISFVAVGSDRCQSACIVSASDNGPDATAVKARLAAFWPRGRETRYAVAIAGRPFLIVTSPVLDASGVARAMVVTGIDAGYLVDQARRTAWVLLVLSYALLAFVGWSSWQQVSHSLAARIHAITSQVRDGSVVNPGELPDIEGAELRELAESVTTYIESTLEERKSSDERYRRLVELAPDAVFMCSTIGIKFANTAAIALAGARHRTDVIGAPIERFLTFEKPIAAERRSNALRPGRWKRLDGRVLHVEVAEISDSASDGTRQYMVRDVTDRREREATLAHRAEHDSLTGLVNRARFESRLVELLESAPALSGDGRHVAVLFIDLDGFKPVNDRHGHAAGDAVLVAVAGRLRESTRDTDLIARLGGDEFAVLLEIADPAEVRAVASRILDAIGRPVEFGAFGLTIGASIGMATTHPAGASSVARDGREPSQVAAELLRAADVAMYATKAAKPDRHLAAREPHEAVA
ncbi:MAG TPA: sensor domain-containing diguanylate cyclase [Gemmatimonadaceae bacterium]|nr:sensor domain-containing diguanylate cyclase [Gemmatimonadaceae bacterium]